MTPEHEAERFLRWQFGEDPKWVAINAAVWARFAETGGSPLGLSDSDAIASRLGVDLHAVDYADHVYPVFSQSLSVVSLKLTNSLSRTYIDAWTRL